MERVGNVARIQPSTLLDDARQQLARDDATHAGGGIMQVAGIKGHGCSLRALSRFCEFSASRVAVVPELPQGLCALTWSDMRTRFIHHCGLRWEVLETPDQMADRAPSRELHRRLYFLSRFSSRASDDFPNEWYRLSDEALAQLCERARIIGAHAPYARDQSTLEGSSR